MLNLTWKCTWYTIIAVSHLFGRTLCTTNLALISTQPRIPLMQALEDDLWDRKVIFPSLGIFPKI